MDLYKIIEKTLGVYSVYKKVGEIDGIDRVVLISEYDSYYGAKSFIKRLLTPNTATE